MEGKIVLNFVFAVLGFFTMLMASQLNTVALFLSLGGFLLLALERLILLSLLQLKRVTPKQLLIQKWLNPVLTILITFGLISGKILSGDTFLPIPFGFFIQLAMAYTVCVITGIFQFRQTMSLLEKD